MCRELFFFLLNLATWVVFFEMEKSIFWLFFCNFFECYIFLFLKGEEGFSQKLLFFSLSKSKVRNYLHVSIILLSLTTIVQKCNLFYSIIERRVFLIFFVLKNQGKSFEKKKWMTFFAFLLHGYFQSFWCCQIDCRFSLASISLGWWIFLRFSCCLLVKKLSL